MKKIDWEAHFIAQPHSGLSVVSYCRTNKLNHSQWYLNKKKQREQQNKPSSQFVPVTIKAASDNQPLARLSLQFEQDGSIVIDGKIQSLDLLLPILRPQP